MLASFPLGVRMQGRAWVLHSTVCILLSERGRKEDAILKSGGRAKMKFSYPSLAHSAGSIIQSGMGVDHCSAAAVVVIEGGAKGGKGERLPGSRTWW